MEEKKNLTAQIEVQNSLEDAAQEGNKDEVENIVEENPIESQQVLDNDKGNELNTEAEQLTDTNSHNIEVRNDAVEDFIEQEQNNPGSSFLNNSVVNWDNVKVYQPGEDDYGRVADFNENAPDFPVDNTVEVKERDEDFLGPDEYIDENGNIQVDPDWKPENADEDFLGPDEYIDENGEIQIKEPENEELPDMTDETNVEDALDSVELQEDTLPEEEIPTQDEVQAAIDKMESIPAENAEEAKRKVQYLNYLKQMLPKARSVSQPSLSSSPTPEDRLSKAGMSTGGAVGNLGTPSGINGGTSSSGYGSDSVEPSSGINTSTVKTGGGTAPVESATTDNVSSVKPATNKFSNGTMSSGASGLMGKKHNSTLKQNKGLELDGESKKSEDEDNLIDELLENGDLNGILSKDDELESLKKELEVELNKLRRGK